MSIVTVGIGYLLFPIYILETKSHVFELFCVEMSLFEWSQRGFYGRSQSQGVSIPNADAAKIIEIARYLRIVFAH
jgi:hypothetical protein